MESPAAPTAPRAVPLRTLFLVWLGIGAQSFGGGQATLSLIRQAVVERRGWVSEEEFARDLTLCQTAPGMNLLALTNLIGNRLAGLWGVIVSLLGLLLPSVSLTILITASLRHVQHSPAVQSALRGGVIPATVGMGLYTTFQTGRTLTRMSRAEGKRSFTFALLLLAICIASAVFFRLPVFVILCAAGLAGAAFSRLATDRAAPSSDATRDGT
jgi:chromate transporter